MATTTTKLALTKPDGTDLVDIAVLNANADKIDAASGATICTSSTRPASPWNGQVIFETDTLNALVYRTSTTSWNILGGSTVSSEPPAGAGNGNFWWDADNGKLYIYYNDGNSSQWVSVMPSQTVVDVTRNIIVNGGFDVWQRGTTINSVGNTAYTADMWSVVTDNVGTVNITQQNVAAQGIGSRYALRAERSAGSNRWVLLGMFEGALAYVGKTLTLSAYIRKGSAFTSDVSVNISARTAKFGTSYDSVSYTATNGSLNTSTFTRVSFPITLTSATSTAGADLFEVEFSANQAGASNAFFEVSGVQLEVGTIPTAFRRNASSYQAELATCQRYYYRNTFQAADVIATAVQFGSTSGQAWLNHPVTMRVTPTSMESSSVGSFRAVFYNGSGGYSAPSLTSFSYSGGASSEMVAFLSLGYSGSTGYPSGWVDSSAGGYIGFSAEL